MKGDERVNKEVIILIVDDDEGHAGLIRKNLQRAGVINKILHFKDGQEILDFLFRRGEGLHREPRRAYIMLLDIRMPKIGGVEVLAQVKADENLRKLPIIMLTTTDDPKEIEYCHELGCSSYVTKPIEYEDFVQAIRQLGLFLSVVQVPEINGKE